MAAGCGQPAQRRGHSLQRPEQDVGENDIERRAGANRTRPDAVGAHERDQAAGAIEPDIVARRGDRAGVNVGRQDARVQRSRRGDREHTAAGADVEDSR